MHCHICDRTLSSITYNRLHQDFDPCGTCLAVINEVFPQDVDEQPDEEVEPTPEEMLADAEAAAYGKFSD